jgi:hypothetical protein
MMVELKDLKLGDVVRLDLQAYGDATVRKINADGTVVVFRPYVHSEDFSYTGGVICYIGTEDVTLHGAPVVLVKRGQPLK